MAIGNVQSQTFWGRYGKHIGQEAVNRQKTHLASEAIKSEARAASQLPNYVAQAQAQKPLLKLPHLAGGVYEQATERAIALTKPQPKVNVSIGAITPEGAEALNRVKKTCNGNVSVNISEARNSTLDKMAYYYKNLEKESALDKVKKTCNGNISVNISEARNSTLDKMAYYYKNLEKESAEAAKAAEAGAKALDKVKKTCNGNISVNISETRNSTLDKMAYYYKNLEKESAEAAKPHGLLGKLKSLIGTPKGKLGLAAAAVTALIAGGVYLYNRNKEDVTPVSDSSPANDLAKLPVYGQMTASGPYTVAKGDNIWNIARAHLMEVHKGEKDYNPTDVEILQRTEEIMKLNDLHYEKDSYRVIIKPDQSLKLVA